MDDPLIARKPWPTSTTILSSSFTITVDEAAEEVLEWSGMTEDGAIIHKSARLPRVIFVR